MGDLWQVLTAAAGTAVCLWMAVRGFRNPDELYVNPSTRMASAAGCWAPVYLLLSLGGGAFIVAMGWVMAPVYWWIVAAVLGPVWAVWLIFFTLIEPGGVDRVLASLQQNLAEGHPPQHIRVHGSSAPRRLLRTIVAVDRPDARAGAAFRDAPAGLDAFRERVRAVAAAASRRWEVIAALAWLPCLSPPLALAVILVARGSIEPSAWYTMAAGAAIAGLGTFLWLRLRQQLRNAHDRSLDLLLAAEAPVPDPRPK